MFLTSRIPVSLFGKKKNHDISSANGPEVVEPIKCKEYKKSHTIQCAFNFISFPKSSHDLNG